MEALDVIYYSFFFNLAKIYFAQAPVENAPPAKSLISNFFIFGGGACWKLPACEICDLANIYFAVARFKRVAPNYFFVISKMIVLQLLVLMVSRLYVRYYMKFY